MKKKLNKLNKLSLHQVKTFLATLLLFVAMSSAVNAQDLQLTAEGCNVSVDAINGNGCEEDECDGDNSCVCLAKGEHVRWLLPGNKFKLSFQGDSPLKENCGKNFKKDKQKCVVKEDAQKGDSYYYLVILEQCAEGSDPRIVIK